MEDGCVHAFYWKHRPMMDVQSHEDNRKVPIAAVGIRNVSHPIFFSDRHAQENTPTVAKFSLAVSLSARKKGTHMSRFLAVLYEHAPHFSMEQFGRLCQSLTERLESHCATLSVVFPYFFEKQAPVTKSRGLAEVTISIEVTHNLKKTNPLSFVLAVEVPITSLCPCSKAISALGAHSQRGVIKIRLESDAVPISKCIEIAEKAASSALYPVLKREDEKFVTEQAYHTPRFVEDLVRETAGGLRELNQNLCFSVEAENFESIHTHNAWALVNSSDLLS